MSVYTKIEQQELEDFLSNYDVGPLKDFRGISEGIENTNYFVDTEAPNSEHHFVLTIFEHHSFDEMQYYLDLMHHLAAHDVPSADPVADNQGRYLRTFKDKPTALVIRLEGQGIDQPTLDQCEQIGAAMGKMHSAGLSFPSRQDNPRGLAWYASTAEALRTELPNDEIRLLNIEIAFQETQRDAKMPRGVIHADLFRDNALWHDEQLSGIIDFYYACDDILLYDLAITANDWCNNKDYSLDKTRVQALLKGYHKHRILMPEEQSYWPSMLRAGALRFWLSRLYDKHFPRPGELTHTKNPNQFKKILTDRINNHEQYAQYWI